MSSSFVNISIFAACPRGSWIPPRYGQLVRNTLKLLFFMRSNNGGSFHWLSGVHIKRARKWSQDHGKNFPMVGLLFSFSVQLFDLRWDLWALANKLFDQACKNRGGIMLLLVLEVKIYIRSSTFSVPSFSDNRSQESYLKLVWLMVIFAQRITCLIKNSLH